MNYKKVILRLGIFLVFLAIMQSAVYAGDVNVPNLSLSIGTGDSPQELSSSIQVLLLLTIITLAPSILILFTSFTRIIISLHFLRAALGTQQMPPNQILIGLSLILTLFIMGPAFTQINDNAFKPFSEGKITQEVFLTEAVKPIREFMFAQVEEKDLILFTELSNIKSYEYKEDIPNTVLFPAFIVGELTKGFKIGFILYLPFIVIDMVVASTLMAMGMMMLPPALISAPFKLLLFVLVDGWNLIIGNLVKTFIT